VFTRVERAFLSRSLGTRYCAFTTGNLIRTRGTASLPDHVHAANGPKPPCSPPLSTGDDGAWPGEKLGFSGLPLGSVGGNSTG